MTEHKKLKHLGIIPDGARRWARENKRTYFEAYLLAMQRLVDIIDICFENGVQIQSIYCLSKENLGRTETDLIPVFKAEEILVTELLPDICDKWNLPVSYAGEIDLLPSSFRSAVKELCQLSYKYDGVQDIDRKLYLLLAYNPWDEILNAITTIKRLEDFRQHFWVKENVDLIIRTGYGQLISNFLPLQSGYAELVFLDKYFNDVTSMDVLNIIANFPRSGKRLIGT